MKINKENREKLKEIIDILFSIQELGAHVFFDYSGHVDTVTVYLYKNGWSHGADTDYQNTYYLSDGRGDCFGENVDECIESLKEIREQLRDKKEEE